MSKSGVIFVIHHYITPTAGLKTSFASIASSPKRKNPKKAVQAMAQRTTFLGLDEVSRILLIWESTGVVMGILILGGVPHGRYPLSEWGERIVPSEICIL